jgi:hypothetical protein
VTIEGAKIIDTGLDPHREGTILGVGADGSVLVQWGERGVSAITPVPGRYLVIERRRG